MNIKAETPQIDMQEKYERLNRIKFVKASVMALVGLISYPGFVFFNKIRIEGTENIKNLPKTNVLFLSNHQTYFAEVIAMLHVFCAVKWGKKDRLGVPYYLLSPFTGAHFVSASETMKKDWVSRLFALAGAIMVKRTWNENSNELRQGLDPSDTRKIFRALQEGWVINFPQGTTHPFAPGRKGSALLIKQNRPIVIPIVIDGFSTAFDKKGVKFKKKATPLSIKFKAPLDINFGDSSEKIMEVIMAAIEQNKIQGNVK
jgi:1-acyl-sn-glycerol-3-phosphate acyltransferase